MSEKDVTIAIRKIEKMLLDGWSIQVATKKACGSSANKLAKEVRSHRSYIELLNYRMSLLKNSYKYEHRDGKLTPINKSDA